MRFRTTVVGGLGVICTIVTAGVLLSPDTFAPIVTAVGKRDPNRLLLVLGGLVGLYAVWSVRRRRTASVVDPASARFEVARERPPEMVNAAKHTATGARFDAMVEWATDSREAARDNVQQTFAETTVQAYARVEECTTETAQQAIATGTWTDDRVAAAFIGGEDSPRYPLWARLRGWLDPSAEHSRRVRRTMDAIRALRTDGESR